MRTPPPVPAAPIKVLHLFGQMQPGGAEMRFVELIGRLPRGEYRVDVCALSGLEGVLDGSVRAAGGRVVPLRLDWRFAPRFLRLLRQERYDVVHANVMYASGPILALARRAGVPVRVAHFHATVDGRPSSIPRSVLRRGMKFLIERCATDVVACGDGVMVATWGANWQSDPRCRVVYYGLDLVRFESPGDPASVRRHLGVPPAAPLFLHLGRESADRQKNHRRVVQMFGEIRRRAPDAWLVLAGAGTDDPAGETGRAIRDSGIREHVLTLGLRRDIPALLQAADALLLPSFFEGVPGVVLEACAAGVPVLASDIPGIREIAAHLQLVRYLPLSAPDSVWAATALDLPAEGTRLELRTRALESFRQSPFHLDRAVEAHCAIWSAHQRNTAIACS